MPSQISISLTMETPQPLWSTCPLLLACFSMLSPKTVVGLSLLISPHITNHIDSSRILALLLHQQKLLLIFCYTDTARGHTSAQGKCFIWMLLSVSVSVKKETNKQKHTHKTHIVLKKYAAQLLTGPYLLLHMLKD